MAKYGTIKADVHLQPTHLTPIILIAVAEDYPHMEMHNIRAEGVKTTSM